MKPAVDPPAVQAGRLRSLWEEHKIWIVSLPIGVAAVVMWVATPFVVVRWYDWPRGAGEFGDIFGSINALFAGLAFWGIIVTILLQRQELKQNTQELRTQANALEAQVRLMTISARLAALPILIRQEKERIWTINPSWVRGFREQDYHPDQLDGIIARLDKDIRTMGHLPDSGGFADGITQGEIETTERQISGLKRLKALVVEMERLADSLRKDSEQVAESPRN